MKMSVPLKFALGEYVKVPSLLYGVPFGPAVARDARHRQRAVRIAVIREHVGGDDGRVLVAGCAVVCCDRGAEGGDGHVHLACGGERSVGYGVVEAVGAAVPARRGVGDGAVRIQDCRAVLRCRRSRAQRAPSGSTYLQAVA